VAYKKGEKLPFLTLALDKNKWSVLRTTRFTLPVGKEFSIHVH